MYAREIMEYKRQEVHFEVNIYFKNKVGIVTNEYICYRDALKTLKIYLWLSITLA